jgi:agmatine/peptidylarginine deiminase
MNNHLRSLPAEWHRQDGIMLVWPHADTDWFSTLHEVTRCYIEIARNIVLDEQLIIVAPSVEMVQSYFSFDITGPESKIHVITAASNDTWARDHGFITVEDTVGGHTSKELVLLDFKFNGWGEKFEAALDNQINKHLYEQGLVKGRYEDHLDFVLEGGSIESDGKGTVFTTTCCLTAPHRNQPLTTAEIEDRLKTWLGAERIVWLNHGSLIGDDTDGHIDTLVRICPDDTLLYIGSDDDHPDLRLMEEELKALRTLDGNDYRLLKLPLPRPIFDNGERLPATYANYLVMNGAVLVPTYRQPDLDAEAMSIISQAFPQREIVGIDCCAVIKQHGSLHCCTMQYY